MSPRSGRERIQDILDAIDEIELFVAGLTREQFLADAKTLKAVVANLTIIGEAARHVPDNLIMGSPDVPWPLMRGMRHRIVHDYFHVDAQIVWETAQNDLAPLREPLQRLLAAAK